MKSQITLDRDEHALTTADPTLIQTVIENLLDNAIRYNTAGGWVRISITARADHTRFEIENSGPHLSAEVINRLTEALFRVPSTGHTSPGSDHPNEDGKGHGIGLALVDAITRKYDAELTVTAGTEGGLKVRIDWQPTPHS